MKPSTSPTDPYFVKLVIGVESIDGREEVYLSQAYIDHKF